MNEALGTADLESVDREIDCAAQAARLESLIQRGVLRLGQVAKGTDLGTAVLSNFKNRRPPYDRERLDIGLKVKAFLDAHLRRLATGNEIPFVRTRPAKETYAAAEFAHQHGVICIVVGDPGVGKTRALRQYALDHPGASIMVTESPATASAKGLLEELCAARRLSESGTLRALERRFCGACSGTGMVAIIDEAHHASDKALSELQSLHDRTGMGLVLCGNPTIHRRASRFPQLQSRVQYFRDLNDHLGVSDVKLISQEILGEATPEIVEYLHKKALGVGGVRTVINIARLTASMIETQQHKRRPTMEDLEGVASFIGTGALSVA
ncbi:MAG TPA: AAA family ATPase [Methylomirabilota bacterium]|nr:AAA family ATPase [Methylomirabilota bacterium]